jgi:hypothetical protein
MQLFTIRRATILFSTLIYLLNLAPPAAAAPLQRIVVSPPATAAPLQRIVPPPAAAKPALIAPPVAPPQQGTPLLTNIAPTALTQGQSYSLTVTGRDLNAISQINFGTGITVNSLNILNSRMAQVMVQVAADAQTGLRYVTVTPANPAQQFRPTVQVIAAPQTQQMADVLSASPQSLVQGQTYKLTLSVMNVGRNVGLNFGGGISITGTQYLSPTVLLVDVAVASTAPVGKHDITMTFQGELAGRRPKKATAFVNVNPAPVTQSIVCAPLNITSSSPLAAATVGQSYSVQLKSLGGQTPVTFAMVSGSLPSGLKLNATGLISGTPVVAGNFSFTAKASDSCPSVVQSAQKTISLSVNSAPATSFIPPTALQPVTLSVTTVPHSFSIPSGQGSSRSVEYKFSGAGSANVALTSMGGSFRVGTEVVGNNMSQVKAIVQSGSGAAPETITIPADVVQKAVQKKSNKITYVRTFHGPGVSIESSIILNVTTAMAANFSLKKGEIYFSRNGEKRYEVTVPKHETDLRAFVDITATGMGPLKGEWVVDGQTIGIVDQPVPRQQHLLQSPPLPTFDPGTHLIRFAVTSSSMTGIILKDITFFVTPEEDATIKISAAKKTEAKAKTNVKLIGIDLKEPKWGTHVETTCDQYSSDAWGHYTCIHETEKEVDNGIPLLNEKTKFVWELKSADYVNWYELRMFDQGGAAVATHRIDMKDYYADGKGHKYPFTYRPDISFWGGLKGAPTQLQWEVAGFKNKSDGVENGPSSQTQGTQVAISDRWRLGLKGVPNGLSCPFGGISKASIDPPRNGTQTNAVNNYPGDKIVLTGHNINTWLANSPYVADMKFDQQGNQMEHWLPNLYLDWGDGTVVQIGKNSEKPEWTHVYDQYNAYTIRIFQLPATVPGQAGTSFEDAYYWSHDYTSSGEVIGDLAELTAAATGYSQMASSSPAPDSSAQQAYDSAYMIFCSNIIISNRQDFAATGPLHLKKIEIVRFEGQGSEAQAKKVSRKKLTVPSKPELASNVTATSKSNSVPIITTCDEGIVAVARLSYYGRLGRVKLTWKVDGVKIQDQVIDALPPSERRQKWSVKNNDWEKSDPIISTFDINSDFLGASDVGEHKVTVEAQVIAESLAGEMNSNLLSSAVSKLANTGQNSRDAEPLPAATQLAYNEYADGEPGGAFEAMTASDAPQLHGTTMLFAKASTGASAVSATNSVAPGPKIGFLSPSKTARARMPAVAYVPSYGLQSSADRVVSEPRVYKVINPDSTAACLFHFPVKTGTNQEIKFFVVQSINKGEGQVKTGGVTKGSDGRYSGTGTILLNLTDSQSGVSRHPIDIDITNWTVEADGITVAEGSIDASPAMTIDDLPGMTGTLKTLKGVAKEKLDATLGITISDNTIREPTTDNPVTFPDLTMPLSPDGDWYADGQQLKESLIGWSAFRIRSNDVRLDLSHQQGDGAHALCQGEQGAQWVGIHLGSAQMIPFAMGLKEYEFPVGNWGIVTSGMCGKADLAGFDKTVGKGAIHFDSITATAQKGSFHAEMHGMKVKVPWWPDFWFTGDAKVLSNAGEAESLTFNLSGNVTPPALDYQNIVLRATGTGFKIDPTWGFAVIADAEFDFRAEDKLFTTAHANKLLFTMYGDAAFDDGQGAHSLNHTGDQPKFGTGGAYKINSLTAESVKKNNNQALSFNFGGSLNIGSGLTSPATINYSLTEKLSKGPEVKIDPVDVNYGDGSVVKLTMKPEYQHSIEGTPQSGPSSGSDTPPMNKIVLASADDGATVQESMSDASPSGFMLLADGSSGGGAGGNYKEVYKGDVNINLLGYDAYAIFRLGYLSSGDDYWLAYANVSGLDFSIFTEVNLRAIGGGVGHNFSYDQIMLGAGNAVPSNTGTSFFTADLTISSADHFIYEATGVFVLETSGAGTLAVKAAKLFTLDGFSGGLTWGNGSFDGALSGKISLLYDYVSLKGDAGLHFGGDGYHIFAGTRTNPITGRVLFAKQDGYMMLGNDSLCKGFFVGTHVNEKIGAEFGGWGAYVEYKAGLEAGITAKPFQLTVDADASLEAKIINPIKDLSAGAEIKTHGCIGECGVEVWIKPSISACPAGKAWIQMKVLPLPEYMDSNFEDCL